MFSLLILCYFFYQQMGKIHHVCYWPVSRHAVSPSAHELHSLRQDPDSGRCQRSGLFLSSICSLLSFLCFNFPLLSCLLVSYTFLYIYYPIFLLLIFKIGDIFGRGASWVQGLRQRSSKEVLAGSAWHSEILGSMRQRSMKTIHFVNLLSINHWRE